MDITAQLSDLHRAINCPCRQSAEAWPAAFAQAQQLDRTLREEFPVIPDDLLDVLTQDQRRVMLLCYVAEIARTIRRLAHEPNTPAAPPHVPVITIVLPQQ